MYGLGQIFVSNGKVYMQGLTDSISMRTIKLPREVKQMIEDEFDTTPNQAIREMLQVTYMPSTEITGGRISVDVDDIVADRLDELKMYSTESVGSVVLRLLLNYRR